MTLTDWARRWGIPAAAMTDLRVRTLGLDGGDPHPIAGPSEAAVQARVRVAASRNGLRVWRNNVGAVHDNATGTHLRYGLANDSPHVNAVCKSADLIGIRPRVIQPGDIGHLIGQFVSFECKHEGWRWQNTDRERAQANWATMVVSLGGDARFVTNTGQI